MKKKFIAMAVGLSLLALTAQAGEALVVHSATESPQGVILNEIRSIDFSGSNSMVVNLRNSSQPVISFALNNVEMFRFGNMPEPGVGTGFDTPPEINLSVHISSQGDVLITGNVQVLSITVFDIHGRRMMASDSDRLNIASLPTAVYLLALETAQGFVNKRIIKQ